MKRHQLEHVVAAAADVTDEEDLVVVGSQAILGSAPEAPEPLLRSMEADMYPARAPDKAEKIDGALGDGSPFHEAFGYYAHGVGPETATPPVGWEQRLVRVVVRPRPGAQRVVTALCLEAHDLVLAKCAAGRERDWEFAEAAIVARVVSPTELLNRIGGLPVDDERSSHIHEMLTTIIGKTPAS